MMVKPWLLRKKTRFYFVIILVVIICFIFVEKDKIVDRNQKETIQEMVMEGEEEEGNVYLVSSRVIQNGEEQEPKYRMENYREGETLEELIGSEYIKGQSEEVNKRRLLVMQYAIEQPTHFRLCIDQAMSMEEYNFRNISVENWENEYGEPDLGHLIMLYQADLVIDTYIREYGGVDGIYEVEYLDPIDLEDPETGCVTKIEDRFKIWNGNVEMELWTYGGLSHVWIKNIGQEKNDLSEYFLLEKYNAYVKDNYIFNNYTNIIRKGEYWMITNPKRAESVREYRNVKPESNIYPVESLGYYIADLAIDKYIRYYKASDWPRQDIRNYNTIYQVEMIGEERDEAAQGYIYHMVICYGEELLKVEYSDYSWLVKVQVMKREANIEK